MIQAHPRRPSGYDARPDYRVDLLPRRNHARAFADGVMLANSRRTILVDEQGHGLVVYFPREDVAIDRLAAMPGRSTFCAYKGEANYFATLADPSRPIAWTYLNPFVQVAAIAAAIAFYQDRVLLLLGCAGDTQPGPGIDEGADRAVSPAQGRQL